MLKIPREIAFGPVTEQLSWTWLGADVGKRLRQYYTVRIFHSFREKVNADVVFVVKNKPPTEWMRRLRGKVVFCTSDALQSTEQISRWQPVWDRCSMVLATDNGLLPFLKPHCRRVEYVNHYGKFLLPSLATYKERGYALWIGCPEQIRHVMGYMDRHLLPLPVILLSGEHYRTHRTRKGQVVRVVPWSVKAQQKMLAECKAGLDIKGGGFFMQHKPPEKPQMFLGSGVPLAINKCSARTYLESQGFRPAEPHEERWLSKEYWQETNEFARRIRPTLSIDFIASQYRQWIEELLHEKTCRLL